MVAVLCRIPDPEAVKPEEWDEEAPLEVADEEAAQPEGWLEDEPDQVDDAGQRITGESINCTWVQFPGLELVAQRWAQCPFQSYGRSRLQH